MACIKEKTVKRWFFLYVIWRRRGSHLGIEQFWGPCVRY